MGIMTFGLARMGMGIHVRRFDMLCDAVYLIIIGRGEGSSRRSGTERIIPSIPFILDNHYSSDS